MNIGERTFSAIQRDRLSEFVKLKDKQNSGCFYDSLISAYNFLFPGQPLDRDIVNKFTPKGTNLHIKKFQMLKEIKRLQPYLKMTAAEIIIPDEPESNIPLTKKAFEIKDEVPVIKRRINLFSNQRNYTIIVLLDRPNLNNGHVLHIAYKESVGAKKNISIWEKELKFYLEKGFYINSVIKLVKS